MTKKDVLLVVLVVICFIVSSSCSAQAIQDPRLVQIKAPVWTEDQLAVNNNATEIYTYNVDIPVKPPYYQGSLPLKYKGGYLPEGYFAAGTSFDFPLFFDFGNYKIYFVYTGTPSPVGAQVYDDNNHLLAEVSKATIKVDQNNERQIEIEEIHYGQDGNAIFMCKSTIQDHTGFKIGETDVVGKKTHEYFVIWPDTIF
jgi:hypothetical protein